MKMMDEHRGEDVVGNHVVRGVAILQRDKRYLAKMSITMCSTAHGDTAITTLTRTISRKHHKTPQQAVDAAIAGGKAWIKRLDK